MKTMFERGVGVLLALVLLVASGLAAAADRVGVILLHGKRGTPDHMEPLADALRREGFLVVAPEMPWSASRAYDRPLEQSHAEIDKAVELLRLQGARRIVVGGHSMGANMAMGYVAQRPGVDALMTLGPGQTVESDSFRDALGASVAQARRLVLAGKGDEPAEFTDLHLGKTSRIRAGAGIYLSYFDPDGLANMPKTAPRIAVPWLWTVGSQDRNMLDRGAGYAFVKAAAHPRNRYAVVEADHMGTPTASVAVVLRWLASVFPETAQ